MRVSIALGKLATALAGKIRSKISVLRGKTLFEPKPRNETKSFLDSGEVGTEADPTRWFGLMIEFTWLN